MTILQPSRRLFLLGASAFLAAPAIVRVASIMPVSVAQNSMTFLDLCRRFIEEGCDVTFVIQQYGCLYGFTDKTWELRA